MLAVRVQLPCIPGRLFSLRGQSVLAHLPANRGLTSRLPLTARLDEPPDASPRHDGIKTRRRACG